MNIKYENNKQQNSNQVQLTSLLDIRPQQMLLIKFYRSIIVIRRSKATQYLILNVFFLYIVKGNYRILSWPWFNARADTKGVFYWTTYVRNDWRPLSIVPPKGQFTLWLVRMQLFSNCEFECESLVSSVQYFLVPVLGKIQLLGVEQQVCTGL